jgi:hypothetical protein
MLTKVSNDASLSQGIPIMEPTQMITGVRSKEGIHTHKMVVSSGRGVKAFEKEVPRAMELGLLRSIKGH